MPTEYTPLSGVSHKGGMSEERASYLIASGSVALLSGALTIILYAASVAGNTTLSLLLGCFFLSEGLLLLRFMMRTTFSLKLAVQGGVASFLGLFLLLNFAAIGLGASILLPVVGALLTFKGGHAGYEVCKEGFEYQKAGEATVHASYGVALITTSFLGVHALAVGVGLTVLGVFHLISGLRGRPKSEVAKPTAKETA